MDITIANFKNFERLPELFDIFFDFIFYFYWTKNFYTDLKKYPTKDIKDRYMAIGAVEEQPPKALAQGY